MLEWCREAIIGNKGRSASFEFSLPQSLLRNAISYLTEDNLVPQVGILFHAKLAINRMLT